MAVSKPNTRSPGYVVTASSDWNTVVNAINHLLELKLDSTALKDLAAAAGISGRVVGEIMTSLHSNRLALSPTWLPLTGETLGDLSSNASFRNPNYEDIFTFLWENLDSPTLYTSAGASSSKGASAAADWAAHKQIETPDARGMVLAMIDNPGGPGAANRLTDSWADAMGGSGGAESVTLNEDELPSHDHKEEFALNNGTNGGYLSNSSPLGQDDEKKVVGGGSANATSTISRLQETGSDQAHDNVQPTMTVMQFIYTGVS